MALPTTDKIIEKWCELKFFNNALNHAHVSGSRYLIALTDPSDYGTYHAHASTIPEIRERIVFEMTSGAPCIFERVYDLEHLELVDVDVEVKVEVTFK